MSTGAAKVRSGPLDLIDEAFHLIRQLPLAILMLYYVGSVPFVLVFLFFWADMSHGALAPQRVAEAALAATGAYIWMKFWHVFFSSRLREWLTGEECQKWSFGRSWRVLVVQAFLQPIGLFLKPVSMIVPFFFIPVFSFFSVITVEGGRHQGVWNLLARARMQSFFRGREIYLAVLILVLFGLFVLINFLTLIVIIPYLLQVLLAVDTHFMRTGWTVWNSTFFISALALTYLALDPLVKAIFVLRSYSWDARGTGEDLRVDLNRVRKRPPAGNVLLLLVTVIIGGAVSPAPVMAAEGTFQEKTETTLLVEELDGSISRVLTQREYVWRLPQPALEQEGEPGLFLRFVTTISDWVKNIWDRLGRAAVRVAEYLIGLLIGGGRDPVADRGPRDFSQGLQVVVFALGAVLIVLTGFILWQAWRMRKRTELQTKGGMLSAMPDIEDEEVAADALPVDEWSRLAEEYKAKGDFRLALRAYYLASLAALAEAQLVVLAKAKSNREYQNELGRRAHDQGERVEAFRLNCQLYEQSWYGMYPVDGDMLARCEMNQGKIKRYEESIAI